MLKNFKDLQVWQKSYKLCLKINRKKKLNPLTPQPALESSEPSFLIKLGASP